MIDICKILELELCLFEQFIVSGGILMFGSVVLFDDEFIHVVSISFTALILTELIMIALTVRTWHWAMVVAEVTSLVVYLLSVILFKGGFGKYATELDNILHGLINHLRKQIL